MTAKEFALKSSIQEVYDEQIKVHKELSETTLSVIHFLRFLQYKEEEMSFHYWLRDMAIEIQIHILGVIMWERVIKISGAQTAFVTALRYHYDELFRFENKPGDDNHFGAALLEALPEYMQINKIRSNDFYDEEL